MSKKEHMELEMMSLMIQQNNCNSTIEKRIIDMQIEQLRDKMDKESKRDPYYQGVGLT